MKIRQLALGVSIAAATFAIGAAAFTAAGFITSLLPAPIESSGEAVPDVESTLATTVPMEPIFVGPSADSDFAPDEPVNGLDRTGDYVLNSETLPKSFADIEYLSIETHEYAEDADGNWTGKQIAPAGSIQTKKALKFDRIAIGGGIVAFQTATVDGVSFKFTGHFSAPNSCSGDSPNLTGRLIKIKNNKWSAEMQAGFYMTCGC